MECEYNGLAPKLVDGEWVEVPCDPSSQRVCFRHKMQHWRGDIPLETRMHIPDRFKQEVTQRELAKGIFDRARETGTELQRAR